MKKTKVEKINIGIRISQQQYDFLKTIALDYNCEPEKIQDIIRAIIVEKMRVRGYLETKNVR